MVNQMAKECICDHTVQKYDELHKNKHTPPYINRWNNKLLMDCRFQELNGGGTGIQELDADFVEDDYVSGPKIEIKFEVPDRAPTCVLKSGTRYSEHVASATFIWSDT